VWTVVALVRYPLVAQQAHWTLASRCAPPSIYARLG
jgi:hypothetical protein